MKRLLITTAATATVFAAPLLQAQSSPEAKPSRQPAAIYTQPTVPQPGEVVFDAELKGYVFGIRMIRARFKGSYNDSNYRIFSDLKTSGLGALLKKLRIWAHTDGKYDRNGLYPVSHTQQNLDKKSRRVEMEYDYDARDVAISINPPNGSFGTPPATPSQQFDSDDVMSAIFNIMLTGNVLDGEVCDGTVKVFDSKQHYGLRMVKAGSKRLKFEGEKVDTLRCHVYYEPIAGFDPEDLPNEEEGGTPVNIYIMKHPETGINVPLRFTYKISGFKAVIKMGDVFITKG